MERRIIVGRSKEDAEKLGDKGCLLLGKQYVKMGQQTYLSQPIYLDVSGGHVILVCGKRGGGKSYSLGVIAEGFTMLEEDVKQNLAIIMLDTMGIYWTMKYPNKQEEFLLKDWNMKAKAVDITIYTPYKYYEDYKKEGIPTDKPFAIKPSMLMPDDWCLGFKQDKYSPNGILISRIILELVEDGIDYSMDDIIDRIKKDTNSDKNTRDAVESMFMTAKNWGVFNVNGTPLEELTRGGSVNVLDVSCYATMPGGWDIKALVIGVVAQHIFIERMKARKLEEFKEVESKKNYFTSESVKKQDFPLVWLSVDEAHEFLPVQGKVASTDALVTIMREGRQPGVCLILATQQPGKIHTDVMTQADIVFSHRITAKLDTEALGLLAQSYMREGINTALNDLPRVRGAAILFDDANERLFSMRIRPRMTWHGGKSPSAIKEKKQELGF
jgi:uncharacterized protein